MGKKRTALPEWFERGISAAYLFILALVMALQNSDSIWGNGETWGDASVYKYVAWMMDLGYMPYKDTFDHKGPLLYCFFLAGRQIASWRGVWVLYFGVLFLSLCLIYLIFRRFCTRPVSCALMLVIFALSFDYAVDNMSPEDLSLPFLACALIIFLDYFLYDKISRWRLLLTGACFGAVLMMKAQMISVWFVFCIAVLIRNLREKTPGKIGYFLVFFLAGCAAVVLPFCIWLVRGGAWKDFIEDYIVFNMKYSRSYSGSTALESLLNKARAAVYYLNRPIVLIGLFLCAALVLLDRSNRSFHAVYLVYLLVTIALASLAGKTYRHYGAGLIVALSYPLAAFASFAGGAARVPAGDSLEESAGDPPRKSAGGLLRESSEEALHESAGVPLRKSAGEALQESA
ncbi:MAG: glycosyltransferase family 39 protein, partial [Eubacteriales bacterium]|nr:glycosyltransferase family 39 protein [Eubacteriales bacterium]